MKERPILFSGPMVRAILAGRKTETRRVVTVPWKGRTRGLPTEPHYVEEDGRLLWMDEAGDYHPIEPLCPHGQPGDRLWVRETFGMIECGHGRDVMTDDGLSGMVYRADGQPKSDTFEGWEPSIFMPRALSRITLDVVGVRAERLHAITDVGACAEGIYGAPSGLHGDNRWTWDGDVGHYVTPREAYRFLWDDINGAKPGRRWHDNPWVWVITFKMENT